MLTSQAFTLRLTAAFARAQTPFTTVRTLASLSTTTTTTYSRTSIPTSSPSLSSPSSKFFLRLKPTSIRHATTAAAASTTTPSSPAYAAAASSILTWNEFFRLRKNRRYYNFFASLSTSLVSLTGGMVLLSQQNLQALGQSMFGLDPMLVMGLWAIGFFGGGWLVGPLVGTGVWGIAHSKVRGAMGAKERDFFERIRRYRVDPTSSSIQNPVPDYYGEKITSVQGYRQWLKDQRAFNKKRDRFL